MNKAKSRAANDIFENPYIDPPKNDLDRKSQIDTDR